MLTSKEDRLLEIDSPIILELLKIEKQFHEIILTADYKKVEEFKNDLNNIQAFQDLMIVRYNSSSLNKYQNAKVNIPVSVFQIQSRFPFICKGFIGTTPVTFFIACGYWDKLKFTPEEKQKGFFNLLDHFNELIPNQNKIGLVTFQNGIGNSEKDFREMGNSIF